MTVQFLRFHPFGHFLVWFCVITEHHTNNCQFYYIFVCKRGQTSASRIRSAKQSISVISDECQRFLFYIQERNGFITFVSHYVSFNVVALFYVDHIDDNKNIIVSLSKMHRKDSQIFQKCFTI